MHVAAPCLCDLQPSHSHPAHMQRTRTHTHTHVHNSFPGQVQVLACMHICRHELGRAHVLQVHWFGIMNSLLVVLVMATIVAMILFRTVLKDLAKYEQLVVEVGSACALCCACALGSERAQTSLPGVRLFVLAPAQQPAHEASELKACSNSSTCVRAFALAHGCRATALT